MRAPGTENQPDAPVGSSATTQVTTGSGSDGEATPAAVDLIQLIKLPMRDPSRYEILGEHARGGIGRILRARDLELGRVLAVKELISSNLLAEARFVREIGITARLEHPGIVPVHDAGRRAGDGRSFYTMKLVAGSSLREVVARTRDLEGRLALTPRVLAVAEAVAYAHSRGVVHRDLKPSNVIVGEFGETIVIDWGLAKVLGDDSDELFADVPGADADLTRVGHVIGTPSFMPPEQARGEPAGTSADVYSLGAIAYFVLSGQVPYEGGSSDEVLLKVVTAPPVPLRVHAPGVPIDLAAIVEKAMARDPAARYPSARELAVDLRQYQAGRFVEAREYAWWEPFVRWLDRHRLLAAVTLVFLVLGATGITWSLRRERELREGAEQQRARAEQQRGRAEQQTLALLETQARRELDAGRPLRAAPLLAEALRREPDRALFRHMLADASGPSLAYIGTLVGHERDVVSTDFSPDGKLLATGSSDDTVRIWHVQTGEVRRVLRGHERGVEDVEWTHGGAQLVSLDGTAARLWRVSDGALLRTFPGSGKSMALTPDGKQLWVGRSGGQLRVFDVDSGAELLSLAAHSDRIHAITIDPAGRRALTAGWDGRIKVWDTATRSLIRTLEDHQAGLRFVSFRADGRYLMTGAEDGTILLRDGATLEVVDRLALPSASHATGGWFGADGLTLVTISADGGLRIWHTDSGSVLVTIDAVAQGKLFDASMSPDRRILVTATLRTVHVWDPYRGVQFRVFAGGSPGSSAFEPGALSADGQRLVAARTSPDGPPWIRVWDPVSGALVSTWQDQGLPYSVAISRDGGRIVVGDIAGTPARLYDGHSGRLVARLLGHRQMVYNVAISADDRYIATASYDRTVRQWQTEDGLPVGPVIELEVRPTAVAFDPDGTRLAVATERGEVRIYDRAQGTLLRSFAAHLTWIEDIEWSPDGTRLVTAGRQDHTGKVWDLVGNAPPVLLSGHADNLIRASFSPDGKTIATASVDETARLWDARTGDLLRFFPGANQTAAFSPDGSSLYTTGLGDYAVAWNLKVDDRDAGYLAARLESVSPWRLQEGRLVLPDKASP